ncbi:hypothetical protein CDIK_2496 [Cucumispora dikerogammari]|nr:hypothetical protein CDIK_2496 [Cucumispora dikerogammari]
MFNKKELLILNSPIKTYPSNIKTLINIINEIKSNFNIETYNTKINTNIKLYDSLKLVNNLINENNKLKHNFLKTNSLIIEYLNQYVENQNIKIKVNEVIKRVEDLNDIFLIIDYINNVINSNNNNINDNNDNIKGNIMQNNNINNDNNIKGNIMQNNNINNDNNIKGNIMQNRKLLVKIKKLEKKLTLFKEFNFSFNFKLENSLFEFKSFLLLKLKNECINQLINFYIKNDIIVFGNLIYKQINNFILDSKKIYIYKSILIDNKFLFRKEIGFRIFFESLFIFKELNEDFFLFLNTKREFYLGEVLLNIIDCEGGIGEGDIISDGSNDGDIISDGSNDDGSDSVSIGKNSVSKDSINSHHSPLPTHPSPMTGNNLLLKTLFGLLIIEFYLINKNKNFNLKDTNLNLINTILNKITNIKNIIILQKFIIIYFPYYNNIINEKILISLYKKINNFKIINQENLISFIKLNKLIKQLEIKELNEISNKKIFKIFVEFKDLNDLNVQLVDYLNENVNLKNHLISMHKKDMLFALKNFKLRISNENFDFKEFKSLLIEVIKYKNEDVVNEIIKFTSELLLNKLNDKYISKKEIKDIKIKQTICISVIKELKLNEENFKV